MAMHNAKGKSEQELATCNDYRDVLDIALVGAGAIESYDFAEQIVRFQGETYTLMDVEEFIPLYLDLEDSGVIYDPVDDPEMVTSRIWLDSRPGGKYVISRITCQDDKSAYVDGGAGRRCC